MMYLPAIFLPPVYFLLKGRLMAFMFSLAALVCSIFLLASLYLVPLIPVLWLACAFWAVWDIHRNAWRDKPSPEEI